jgi:hypothetical protein
MFKLAFLSLLLVSCSTLQDLASPQILKPDPKIVYRYDMKLTVNGVSSSGVLVVRKAPKYDIEIESKQTMDLLTVKSCHREMVLENVNERYGLFGTKRRNGKVGFTPQTLELEDCPLDLTGFSKDTGKHSFGFIDFENDIDKLPATLRCDGTAYQAMGVSACGARFGLVQEIEFASDVAVHPDANCPLGEIASRSSGKKFIFPVIKGVCTYIFKEEAGEKKTHRLTTIGYEEILVRSIE